MVHALEEIHRLLKPGGELIDIHPVSEHSQIEIHRNGKIDPVGYLEVPQWCVDFEQADNALTEIIQRGLYSIGKIDEFDTLTYYDTADEMGTSIKESIHKYARDSRSADEDIPQVEGLAARADDLLQAAGSGAALVLRERDHISRLKRM